MATASTPIEIRGRYFWRGNERFMIRGVFYQDYNQQAFPYPNHGVPNDEIADDRLPQLEHDIGLFKELGLNAIFVYWIDNRKCHDKAMKLLEHAGIYVLTSISTPAIAVNRLQPCDSYNHNNMSHFFKTADILAAYPNCLGLLAASETINSPDTVRSAPVIRAVVRDLKHYLRLRHEVTGQRILPVGYSAADVISFEKPTREYLAAGDEASRIDFWSKNDYSWASPSDMQISGYNHQLQQYSDFNIPTFWSEYGANCNSPRDFGETAALYSPEMTHIFSGGFAYEFYSGGNGYGLVRFVTGKEASKWRRAHNRFEKISAESVTQDLAKMSLSEYANTEDGGGRKYKDDRGKSRMLDKTIAEYRETSRGEIVLYKDFMNLKKSFDITKDITPNTDPDWVNSEVTATRAPAWPSQASFGSIVGETNVPDTCVDWQSLEERMRDEEYVLIDDDQEATS